MKWGAYDQPVNHFRDPFKNNSIASVIRIDQSLKFELYTYNYLYNTIYVYLILGDR